MGDQYHAHVQFLSEFFQKFQYLRLDHYVKSCCGLISYDELRIAGKRHGDHGSLLHSAGEFMRILGNSLSRYAHQFEEFACSLPCFLLSCTFMSYNGLRYLPAHLFDRIEGVHGTLEYDGNVFPPVVLDLFLCEGRIVCPFKLTVAMAENAAVNGAEFRFDTRVENIYSQDGAWHIVTDKGEYISRAVVNAAGVYSDVLNNMVSDRKLSITPRRGDYILLDRAVEGYVSHTVFQLPTKLGKGVLVTPTVHGNTIVGPTAIDIEDKESTATTADGIDSVIAMSALSIKALPTRQVITSFAGLRANEAGHDFIIGEAEDADGFFNCAGIASPGLSAAPAIGRYVAGLIRDKLELSEKTDFIAQRKDILDPKKLSLEERNALIKEQPAYGTIVCRCESVTEGEIIDAIKRPVGARSLDGVKRRTRAGMGRCQSGFCSPRVMEILHRELGIDLTQVTKSGGDSYIVNTRTKDGD